MSHTCSYLILFIPLIASVFCFLINFKKTDFFIFLTTAIIALLLAIKLGSIVIVSGAIVSATQLGILSIPTEYYLDFLAIFFLVMVILARIIMVLFYQNDIEASFNNDTRQLFYVVGLLNLFAAIGILVSNNIFNLYVFIEIYCLTFASIMATSDDLSLSKLAFKYFTTSAAASIMLLVAFILLYILTGELKINVLAGKIDYLFGQENYIPDLLFLLILVAIILKFFPIWFYLQKISSKDRLASFLLSFDFIINGIIGFYLLIRLLFFLFKPDLSLFNVPFSALLVPCGLILVFYSSFKILKTESLSTAFAYLAMTNLALVLIAIGFFDKDALSGSLFYIVNYALANFLILLLASYLRSNFPSCHLKYLSALSKNYLTLIVVILISALSLGLLFWANWNLILLALDISDSMIVNVCVIASIIASNLAMIALSVKIMHYSYFYHHGSNQKFINNKADNFLPLLAMMLLLLINLVAIPNHQFIANFISHVNKDATLYGK